MANQTIVFNAYHLNERGMCNAMYDYAHFNEVLLGNHSIIFSPVFAINTAYRKFKARFPVHMYTSEQELNHYLNGVDYYYTIVHGEYRDLPQTNAKTLVHAVFEAFTPYGNTYATVSDWIAKYRSCGSVPVVPHMIHLPKVSQNMRKCLNIPLDAIVFGRHGGYDTFNVPFVASVIEQILDVRRDIYFVFLNTQPFIEHPRVIYLPATHDRQQLAQFIHTCDAMIHARWEGETFGLAVGEFSVANKPVITFVSPYDNHHVQILGDKGFYFQSADEMYSHLMNFVPKPVNYDALGELFSPLMVMKQFEQVFLQ